jgi:ribosomal protein S18 acetylase RimI-like enzyme
MTRITLGGIRIGGARTEGTRTEGTRIGLPPRVGLRRARPVDLPALVRLARRCWLDTYSPLLPASDIAAFVLNDHARIWMGETWRGLHLAVRGGEILGFVEVQDDLLAEIWIHPLHQGRGIGGTLLAFAEARIAESGHALARLETLLANRKAQGFYRAHGWEPAGTRPNRFATSEQRNLVMVKRLGG